MVNILRCSLSKWTGERGACKWCNAKDVHATLGKGFCSKSCMASFWNNHQYTRAKALVFAWHATCGCRETVEKVGYDYYLLEWHSHMIEPPHVVCAACGECEAQVIERGDKMTVNHINPRYGIPTQEINCIHHVDNLEPLCWRCHEVLNKHDQDRSKLESFVAHLARYG